MAPILPTFFVVGAAKAGTTSLWRYLAAHPGIHMSLIKEPNYFAKDIDTGAFSAEYKNQLVRDYRPWVNGKAFQPAHIAHVSDLNDYAGLFADARHGYPIGECSASYLFSRAAAEEIAATIKNPRIVILLRDPKERAFSQYLMDSRVGCATGTFLEEVRRDFNAIRKEWGTSRLYIENGMYFAQVKRYLDVFGPAQIRVWLYEDIKQDLRGFVRGVYAFVGARQDFEPDLRQRHNGAVLPRFHRLNSWMFRCGLKGGWDRIIPPILLKGVKRLFYKRNSLRLGQAEREELLPFFREDIGKLQVLIGRDLSGWLI